MSKFSKPQVIVALAIAFVGCLVMWIIHPINNYMLNNSAIADNHFPEIAITLMLLLILVINPILMLFSKTLRLSVRQLALIFAILFVGAVPLMTIKIFPHTLAKMNMNVIHDKTLNKVHKEMDLPSALYLDPDLDADEAPVSEQMNDELYKGNSIPWGSWFKPSLAWGIMVVAMYLVMGGLALILFPQWRDNERLAFPTLTVMHNLIEKPEDGTKLPPIFRKKSFWITCAVVIIIHSFNGLNFHTGGAFPGFPRSWDLSASFTEGMWRHAHYGLTRGYILFTMVGITYFMPNRVGFSLWFFYIAYQIHRMIGYEYLAPFNGGCVSDHRDGAVVGVAIIIMWLSRKHWGNVFKAMFKPVKEDEEKRNRVAGWIFTGGMLLFMVWMLWARVGVGWTLFFMFMLFVSSLIMARIVAETGIPFFANRFGPRIFYRIIPASWWNGASIYISGLYDFFITEGAARVSGIVMLLQGLGVDKENKPRTMVRLMGVFMVVLVLGLVVAGVVHLYFGYNNPASLDGKDVPFCSWGPLRIGIMENLMRIWERGGSNLSNYNQPGHMFFGLIFGAALQVACLLSPAWPLHPIGLLMAGTWYIDQIWPSILVGWTLKTCIISYSGAQGYRYAKPIFIGMIVGEIFAAIFWALIPVILILCGMPPEDVGHITIIPQ